MIVRVNRIVAVEFDLPCFFIRLLSALDWIAKT